MNCQGCGFDVQNSNIDQAINSAVDEILHASLKDAAQHGGVCPLCGHSKAVSFWQKKGFRIALGLACLLLACAAFFLKTLVRSPDTVTQQALNRVRQNADVVCLLGTPIQAGWLTHGNINQDETGWGEARLDIPIHGPKGSAKVFVVAGKSSGAWVFAELTVLIEQDQKKVDLVRGRVEEVDPKSYQTVHSQSSLKPQLLPIPLATPTWDGTYPALTIDLNASTSGQRSYSSSITSPQLTLKHPAPVNRFEVDLHSGLFVLRQTDLFVADTIPLALTRSYRPWAQASDAFGIGANHPYDVAPSGTRNPYTFMQISLEDGRVVRYQRISIGTGYADAVYRHDATASEFYNSQISWTGSGWLLDQPDHSAIVFPESYNAKNKAQGAPVEMYDAQGHRLRMIRDAQRNLTQLVSPSGRTIHFKYDDKARIVEANDESGNLRRYSYNDAGLLETVSDATHVLFRFTYDDLLHYPGYERYLMTTIRDGDNQPIVRNEYEEGRVVRQTLGNGEMYRYHYTITCTVQAVAVTLPSGSTKHFDFDKKPCAGN